jgi:iron complex transport system substrate-binding protein
MALYFRKRSFFTLIALFMLLPLGIARAQDGADTFPVTIEHKFGGTTITEAPERVVAIGFTEQDLLLAVGITPVAVRYWYGDETNAIFPWAQDRVEGDNPIVLNMTYGNLNYEAILALEPDLISAVTAGITQEEYELLSQIAPTIAQSGDYIDFGMPWQAATQMIGDAVGKSDEAAAAIAEVDALFADARAKNPEFEGKTVAVMYNSAGTYGYYTAQDTRGRFFTDLGFVVPDELVDIAGDAFYADISAERFDLIDQELIAYVNLQFTEGGREALEADPLFGTLGAVQAGHVLYFDELAENALHFSSPLSLAYALESALPQLEAMFGEADTAAPKCEAGFHLFDHERLATDPVCVPDNPQRVVSLDMPATEFLLLNDIPFVGVFGYAADEIAAITPGLADELADIQTFDWPPNLELLTELDPDLIIAFKDSSLFYEGMDAIAPVVVYDAAYATDWKSSTAFWSQVFQKEDAYAEMLATYDARVAELQAALGEERGDIEVSLFVPSETYPMIWLVDSAQGVILQDVGLGRPAAQAVTFADGEYTEGGADYGYVAISNERLDLADGEEIFIFTWASTDPAVVAENQQYLEDFNATNLLWQALSGVKAGNVHIVGAHWFRAQTYLAAHLALDDLFATLTDVEPTLPSPAAPLLVPAGSN